MDGLLFREEMTLDPRLRHVIVTASFQDNATTKYAHGRQNRVHHSLLQSIYVLKARFRN